MKLGNNHPYKHLQSYVRAIFVPRWNHWIFENLIRLYDLRSDFITVAVQISIFTIQAGPLTVSAELGVALMHSHPKPIMSIQIVMHFLFLSLI